MRFDHQIKEIVLITTSDLEVNPLSNSEARFCSVNLYRHAQNQKISSSVSEKIGKTLKVGYLIPC